MNLEQIKAHTIECGDCWQWTGSSNGHKHPKVYIRVDGRRTFVSARRLAYTTAKGPIERKAVVCVTCDNPLCVNPAHLRVASRSEVTTKSLGRPTTRLKKAAAAARFQRARSGKLTMDLVRQIRADDRPARQWAEEIGVCKSLIWRVRQGKAWRDYHNPFAALGARA